MSIDLVVHELPGGGHAVFSTRLQGNMSNVGGDGCEHGLRSRERLRRELGVRGVVRGYQVHGTVVGRVHEGWVAPEDEETQPTFEADGHAVAAPGVAAMVLTADCVPVVLGAEGAVASLHAGWRGLAAGVLEEGVLALREVGGGGAVVAIVGPCAGCCCYEVGEEVHGAFDGAHRHGSHIDLRAIARERLLSAGVSEVRDLDACTICDGRYFSHRREGTRAGRQVALAWMQGP
jgi:purine-nucleoside/S-methyl-5'-thioadenosine phosphorylase / adenosine deaminase